MATITEKGNKTALLQSDDIYEQVISSAIAAADTLILEAPLTAGLSHIFVGVQMFDAQGALLVDSAGTFTVTVKTVNTQQWEAVPDGVIDATAPATVDFAANLADIRVVPAALSSTITYKVIVTGNGA